MAAELRRVALMLAHDPSVRAVLVQSFGRVFCGGGDLGAFAAEDPADVPAYIESLTIDLHAALARFARMDAPVVAAVTGSARAAGPTGRFGLAKQVLYGGPASSLEDAMERESRAISAAAATADAREGIAAFIGKRAPRFGGR